MIREFDLWVVTYRIELHDNILVTEFYRGHHDECVRILNHSGEGSNDQHRTGRWCPIIGTLESWEDFLTITKDSNGEFVAVGPWS